MNLFWYNFWFTDYKYFYPLHQDKILRAFFYIYVNYGMFFPTHPLLNVYWYRTKDIKLTVDLQYNLKAFRSHNTPYDQNDEFGRYKTRIKISCMYISRVWILRFADWFILCFYSLRPKETTLVRKVKLQLKAHEVNSITIDTSNNNTRLIKRLKFLLAYRFHRYSHPNVNYLF